MDPKRLAKLQAITDWELTKPQKNEEWAEDVKAENLDVKFDYQLQEMLESHMVKAEKFRKKELDVFTNFPDFKRYQIFRMFEEIFDREGNPKIFQGKTFDECVTDEFDQRLLASTWKVAKLDQSNLRIAKEIELRANGYLEVKEEKLKGTLPKGSKLRIPLGTTYYIDPVNGTNTFAGTRIDSTVDSTADTTHFVDDALTGADDYILNSYFYNVTRGIGSLISDFVALTDTVTLASAIAGMAAGDTYYILNAWIDLDVFTENARTAGDKVIIRRGANRCDNASDLLFTSDGTIPSPLKIEADFDNLWRDQVDLSVTGTATFTFGSKTVTFSADISAVLAAGDWIYASGDDNREFAYEVTTVVTTTVTLLLPYKGNQAGSGKTVYNIQDNALWGAAASALEWIFNTDTYWKVQGVNVTGNDVNGLFENIDSPNLILKDCAGIGNGNSYNNFLKLTNSPGTAMILKSRLFNGAGISCDTTSGFGTLGYVENCLFNGNSVANAIGAYMRGLYFKFNECEFLGFAGSNAVDLSFGGDSTETGSYNYFRNCLFSSNTTVAVPVTKAFVGFEDYDRTLNNTQTIDEFASSTSVPTTQSDSTIVRSGGSIQSMKVTPNNKLSTSSEMSRLMLFEIPIYTTTASKIYTVYFRPSATGDWSADPTASELWIELEAWGHATNNFRQITKSTGTIDMNGSTDWQALTVTVAPAQAGVAYLKCWYAKTKEAGSNIFYVDPVPIIS